MTSEDIHYKYSAVPTVKRFSQSRKFIRGLMGPVGSGKSSGCVIELVKWGARQKPMADGKRRARFAVIRNTYQQLNDTTIKTFHQWVPPHEFGTYMKSDHTYLITDSSRISRSRCFFEPWIAQSRWQTSCRSS